MWFGALPIQLKPLNIVKNCIDVALTSTTSWTRLVYADIKNPMNNGNLLCLKVSQIIASYVLGSTADIMCNTITMNTFDEKIF